MSRYVVVRYFPVSDNGECVNAGVIAYDDTKVLATFVDDWRRLQRFGHEDITFLREFARDVERRSSLSVDPSIRLTKVSVEEMASRWAHAVQFSQPAGSTLSVEELLKEISEHFLPNPKVILSSPRNRTAAKKVAREALREAFVLRGVHKPTEFIRSDSIINGKVKQHKLDFVVSNGRPRDGISAFSFEGGISDRLMTEVEATGYAFGDLREAYPDLELSVVVLEPEPATSEYQTAINVFKGINAKVVTEADADAWAEEVAGRSAHA